MIKGSHHAPEARDKLRTAAIGRVNPMLGRSRPDLADLNRRRLHNPAAVRRSVEGMALANRGRPLAAEHKAKISNSLQGRKMSQETKAKLSAAARRPRERLRRRLQAIANNLSMSRAGTLPERIVGAYLTVKGANYKSQFALPGAPFKYDFAVPSKRLLIEVDGCYWHGCARCGHAGKPDTIRVDKLKSRYARRLGWNLIRIRSCKLERK